MLIATGAVVWIFVVLLQFFFLGYTYRQPGYTFLAIAILLLGGVQIFLIGLVGEYLRGRMNRCNQGRFTSWINL